MQFSRDRLEIISGATGFPAHLSRSADGIVIRHLREQNAALSLKEKLHFTEQLIVSDKWWELLDLDLASVVRQHYSQEKWTKEIAAEDRLSWLDHITPAIYQLDLMVGELEKALITERRSLPEAERSSFIKYHGTIEANLYHYLLDPTKERQTKLLGSIARACGADATETDVASCLVVLDGLVIMEALSRGSMGVMNRIALPVHETTGAVHLITPDSDTVEMNDDGLIVSDWIGYGRQSLRSIPFKFMLVRDKGEGGNRSLTDSLSELVLSWLASWTDSLTGVSTALESETAQEPDAQQPTAHKPVFHTGEPLKSALEASVSSGFSKLTSYQGAHPTGTKKLTPVEFVRLVHLAASRALTQRGWSHIDPAWVAAQACLETGWGKHMPGPTVVEVDKNGKVLQTEKRSSNNVFGIKAGGGWRGKISVSETREVLDGETVKVQAAFRAYDSIENSVADLLNVLSLSRYDAVRDKLTDSPEAYGLALAEGGYATDPEYAQKIASVFSGGQFKRAINEKWISDVVLAASYGDGAGGTYA